MRGDAALCVEAANALRASMVTIAQEARRHGQYHRGLTAIQQLTTLHLAEPERSAAECVLEEVQCYWERGDKTLAVRLLQGMVDATPDKRQDPFAQLLRGKVRQEHTPHHHTSHTTHHTTTPQYLFLP
jgi:hypothetical protein